MSIAFLRDGQATRVTIDSPRWRDMYAVKVDGKHLKGLGTFESEDLAEDFALHLAELLDGGAS